MPGRGPDGTATAGVARKRASAASECDAQICYTLCHRVTHCDTYVSNRYSCIRLLLSPALDLAPGERVDGGIHLENVLDAQSVTRACTTF